MNYNFKVTATETGQRRAYGDSYYSYIVENESEVNYADHVVKLFCTGFLRPAKYSEQQRRDAQKEGSGNANVHFSSYYTKFEKIGDRKFAYQVVEPSTH